MKKLLAIVVLSLLWFNYSNANPSLKGMDNISIMVEYLSSSAKKCGLTRNQVITSAKYILQNSQINVVPTSKPSFTLYINPNISYHSSGYCFSNVRISVYDSIFYKGRFADAVYYQETIMMSGGTGSTYGSNVISVIERMLKKLVVKWSEANN